jgi:hypothetical protein
MKKLIYVFLLCFLTIPIGVQAYSITDSPNDSIGYPLYESYGINVFNFTPGSYTGDVSFSLFTNFPKDGETVNGNPPWTTRPADVFITESYMNSSNPLATIRKDYLWAIPLVDHDGFTAGQMYAVGTYKISDQFDPSNGTGYIYNHNVMVSIETLGSNYGFSTIPGLNVYPVTWTYLGKPGNPDYRVDVRLGNLYEDDPNGTFKFMWGTATCANDVVSGQVPANVPEPAILLLMGIGSGIMGAGIRRLKRKFK